MIRCISRNSKFILASVAVYNNEKITSTASDAANDQAYWDRLKEYFKEKKNAFFKPKEIKYSPTYVEMMAEIGPTMTGWDRIKFLFKLSEHKVVDPSISYIFTTAVVGGFSGFVFGGMRDYVKAFNLFMETNDATKFYSATDARRALAKVGFEAFIKGGTITSFKAFTLVGIFMTTNTLVSVYRGKSGILEWPISGAVTTAVMKWNLGIRGMFSGMVSGGLTGLLMGPFIYFSLKITGNTLSDIKFITHKYFENREGRIREKTRENHVHDLMKLHCHVTKDLPPGFPDDPPKNASE